MVPILTYQLMPTFEGYFLGGGLIIAIGAQNAYLIRQGVRGEHVFFTATLCFLSDALLIAIGTTGIGALLASDHLIRSLSAWGGAIFLIFYGFKSALALLNPKSLISFELNSSNPRGIWKITITTLALTFLNPHVYLDTIVLVGGVAAQYDETPRTYFTLGAILASCTWFYGLAFFSMKVAPFFETKGGIRLLDGAVCTVMWIVAFSLIRSEIV